MTNNNPFSLVVNAEDALCVVEFDVDSDGNIDYETWEVFYNKDFKRGIKHGLATSAWVIVNDLLHVETWESIEAQIKAQWDDVEGQQRDYDENY